MKPRPLLAIGIGGIVVGSLLPFVWFLITSLKSQGEIEAVPPTWWPSGGSSFTARLLSSITFSITSSTA